VREQRGSRVIRGANRVIGGLGKDWKRGGGSLREKQFIGEGDIKRS